MNDRPSETPADFRDDPFDPAVRPELYDGVLSRRIVAFFVDALAIIAILLPVAAVLAVVIFVIGIITFGIGWLLFGILFGPLFVVVALGYIALTLGGPRSATLGMRMTGLEMRLLSGRPMFPLLAIVHAVLFWFSVSVLTPFILLVALFSNRRRLLHDIVLGTVVINRQG